MSRLSAPHRAFHRCGCCGTRGTGSTGKGAYMQAKCPQGVPLAGSRCCALAAPRCMKQESRRWTAHYCLCVWREATTPTSTPITKPRSTGAAVGFCPVVDDERAVADAGIVLTATLAARLGVESLVDRTVDLGDRPGAANAGAKVMTLVS